MRQIRFGVYLSHQYPQEDNVQQRIREALDLVETCRNLGFDSVFTLQHFLGNLQTLQPISLLNRLIDRSGTMRLGTGVLLAPFIHPVHLAEEMATLDQLSEGRLILGLGTGYRDNEYRAFGVDKAERAGRLRETVELVRQLWSGDEVNYRGKYYRVEGERIGIRPLQQPPPIWLGAYTDAALRRVAQRADAWVCPPGSKLAWVKRRARAYRQALVDLGRDPDQQETAIMLETAVAPDTATARREAIPYIDKEYEAYSVYGLDFFRTQFGELIEEAFVFGDPERVTETLNDLVTAGFNHLIFRVSWGGIPHETAIRSVRLLAEEVRPRLAAAR